MSRRHEAETHLDGTAKLSLHFLLACYTDHEFAPSF
jgi:hypothetical protein